MCLYNELNAEPIVENILAEEDDAGAASSEIKPLFLRASTIVFIFSIISS